MPEKHQPLEDTVHVHRGTRQPTCLERLEINNIEPFFVILQPVVALAQPSLAKGCENGRSCGMRHQKGSACARQGTSLQITGAKKAHSEPRRTSQIVLCSLLRGAGRGARGAGRTHLFADAVSEPRWRHNGHTAPSYGRLRVCVCVCVCVCVYAYMRVCMYVCIYQCKHAGIHAFQYVRAQSACARPDMCQ